MNRILVLAIACAASACSPADTPDQEAQPERQVVTSGKSDVPLDQVPPQVLEAARAAQAGITITEAEAETRDGRRYFDIGGTLPEGGEIEFDIMEDAGAWRVVETQRDIAFAAVPEAVRAAHTAGFTPGRVIESTQADGLVIYELFGEEGGDPEGRKVEIKWDGRRAELLTEEWAH